MSAEVEGFKELASDIERLAKNLQKSVVLKALREGAELLAQKIKDKAPLRTGKLKGSIKTRKLRSEWYEPTLGIEVKEFYGRFQEFGWIPRNKNSQKNVRASRRDKRRLAAKARGGKRVGERPYIRPAFHEHAEEAGNLILDELGDAIERSFAGGT